MADKSQETAMDVSEERTEKDPKTSSASGGEAVEQEEDVTEEEMADTTTAEGDANGELDVSKMKVTELRAQLKDRGLDTKGTKAVLVERLQEAINAEVLEGEEEDGTDTGDDILEDVKPEETKDEAMEVEEQKEGAKEEGKTEEPKEEVKEGAKKEETKEEESKKSEKESTPEAKDDKDKKTEQAKDTKEEKKEEVEVVEVANPPPPELPKFWKAVKDNPGDFTGWTYLLQYVEQKNHLESVREAFNSFFERYPYCYGYWKKFADTERRHSNMEQAKEIFERGLKSIHLSIDLWIHFVNFTALMHEGKPEKAEKVREMYERAVDTCGIEFRSDKLWDAYIKFETENKEWQRVTAIYDRLFTIPTQLYSHHFDKFKEFVQKHHPKDIISLDEFIKFRLEVVAEKGPVEETEGPIEGGDGDDDAPPGCDEAPPGVDGPNKDVESKPITDEENKAIQQKIIALRETEYKKNEQEVSKRWAFEEGIRRPYFHAKALEKGQLKNWKEYLDFEITNGTHERVVVLFERCLIACALYEDYWIKYAKYMESHSKEEVSTIYRRACTIHLMKKPNIHLHWAAFEEEQGNIDTAREVLAKLEENLPNLVMVTLERINLERRHGNTDNVMKLYEDHIKDATNEKVSSFYSIRLARYLCKVMSNRDKAQTIIEAAVEKDKENIQLYLQLFDLELQKKPLDEDSILCLFDVVQELPFDTDTKVRFSHRRLEYLLDFGTDVGKLHTAQEEHQKLLKVKEEEQKAAIAAASAAVAKKRTTDQSGGGQPIKKARPEGREAARLFHQQQSNFQQNQGYSYNQGQWGNFQPIPDPPGQDDVIVIDDDQASNADVWAWSIGEEDSESKKSSRNGSSRKRSDSRSRDSSRRRDHGRDSPKRRRGRSRSRSPRRNRSRSPRRTAHSRSPNRSARPRSPSRHQRSRSPSKSKTTTSSKAASSTKAKSSTPSESEKKKTAAAAATTEKIQEEMKDVQNAWQGAGATLRMLAAESSEVEEVQYEVTDVYESSPSPEVVETEPILEVEGFVHNMTPIKSGKNSAKYFYAILQVSQKDYINMVCFSTEKHELLMSMARSKGALKFSNITYIHGRIGSGGKDVTVNTRTRISKTSVKFYATKPFWSFLANFCSLHSAETRVADGDHIHVAVTVQSCNNKTDQQIVRGNEVDRKDFVVTDKSGNITLSTWGEYTDVLQIGKTYMVGNVTVKLHKGVKCLNTNIRTSIIEGVWDRKKHELDYTIVFPSVYPEDGGSSLEDQKKVALQPSPARTGLLGQAPSRISSRDSSSRSAHHSGGDYLGSRSLGSSVRSSSTTNPYQNYQQPWGNYQQNYYGGSS